MEQPLNQTLTDTAEVQSDSQTPVQPAAGNTPPASPALIGEVSAEQIATWKATHGIVKGIKVGGHIGYCKVVDRKILSFAQQLPVGIKQNEVVLKECWLGGSEEIRTNDSLFLSCQAQINQLHDFKKAELVNF